MKPKIPPLPEGYVVVNECNVKIGDRILVDGKWIQADVTRVGCPVAHLVCVIRKAS